MLADDDGLVDGVLDGIFVHPLDAAAELGDAAPGLVDLFVGKRALHGEEDAADLRVRQTQLREHVQPRHGAGGHNVVALPAGADVFLRPGRHDLRLHTELRQQLLEPVHPLGEPESSSVSSIDGSAIFSGTPGKPAPQPMSMTR